MLNPVSYTHLDVYKRQILGVITTTTEWKQIHCVWYKKLGYIFSFPVFMMSYVFIAVIALFRKVEWKPIKHSVVKTVDEVTGQEAA